MSSMFGYDPADGLADLTASEQARVLRPVNDAFMTRIMQVVRFCTENMSESDADAEAVRKAFHELVEATVHIALHGAMAEMVAEYPDGGPVPIDINLVVQHQLPILALRCMVELLPVVLGLATPNDIDVAAMVESAVAESDLAWRHLNMSERMPDNVSELLDYGPASDGPQE